MRAVLCHSFTGPEDLRVGEIEEPKPASDEILVDLHATSVSFMDHLLVSGGYQMRPPTPFVPGTEGAGIIAAIGTAVTRFKPGDRVTMIQCPLGDGRNGGAIGFVVTKDCTWYNAADGGCRANASLDTWKKWLEAGYTSKAQAEAGAKT